VVEQDQYLDSVPSAAVREDASLLEEDNLPGVSNIRLRSSETRRPEQSAESRCRRRPCWKA